MYIYNNHIVKCIKGVLKCIKVYYIVLSNTYYSNTPYIYGNQQTKGVLY
jgi:hypothetical protein